MDAGSRLLCVKLYVNIELYFFARAQEQYAVAHVQRRVVNAK